MASPARHRLIVSDSLLKFRRHRAPESVNDNRPRLTTALVKRRRLHLDLSAVWRFAARAARLWSSRA
jgi:hypothetical protein